MLSGMLDRGAALLLMSSQKCIILYSLIYVAMGYGKVDCGPHEIFFIRNGTALSAYNFTSKLTLFRDWSFYEFNPV